MRAWVVIAVVVGWATVARADTVQPSALVLVIDRALPQDKLDAVTTAVAASLDSVPAGEQLAVISAGPSPSVVVPLQSGSNTKAIAARLAGIRNAKRTDLIAALRAVERLPRPQGMARHVLVVTDGDELIAISPAAAKLRSSGYTVSALGYQSLNRVVLQNIANAGGGQLYLADDDKAIVRAVVAEAEGVKAPEHIAVAFVIDRSGSMSGPKLEAAKELVRSAAEMLLPDDTITVIAFDSEAQVFVPAQRAANRMRIASEIARLQAGGGTNIYVGLKEAFDALHDARGASRRVILISDGESPPDGIADLVEDMRTARITVTTIGLVGADRTMLQMIAAAGDGRMYMVDEVARLPSILSTELGRP